MALDFEFFLNYLLGTAVLVVNWIYIFCGTDFAGINSTRSCKHFPFKSRLLVLQAERLILSLWRVLACLFACLLVDNLEDSFNF